MKFVSSIQKALKSHYLSIFPLIHDVTDLIDQDERGIRILKFDKNILPNIQLIEKR